MKLVLFAFILIALIVAIICTILLESNDAFNIKINAINNDHDNSNDKNEPIDDNAIDKSNKRIVVKPTNTINKSNSNIKGYIVYNEETVNIPTFTVELMGTELLKATKSNIDGRFVFECVPAGKYVLSLMKNSSKKCYSQNVIVKEDTDSECVLCYNDNLASIEITLKGNDNSLHSTFKIKIDNTNYVGGKYISDKISINESKLFNGIVPGEVTISVYKQNERDLFNNMNDDIIYNLGSELVLSQVYSIESNIINNININIPSTSLIIVPLNMDYEQLSIRIDREKQLSRNGTIERNKRTLFDNIVEGTWRISRLGTGKAAFLGINFLVKKDRENIVYIDFNKYSIVKGKVVYNDKDKNRYVTMRISSQGNHQVIDKTKQRVNDIFERVVQRGNKYEICISSSLADKAFTVMVGAFSTIVDLGEILYFVDCEKTFKSISVSTNGCSNGIARIVNKDNSVEYGKVQLIENNEILFNNIQLPKGIIYVQLSNISWKNNYNINVRKLLCIVEGKDSYRVNIDIESSKEFHIKFGGDELLFLDREVEYHMFTKECDIIGNVFYKRDNEVKLMVPKKMLANLCELSCVIKLKWDNICYSYNLKGKDIDKGYKYIDIGSECSVNGRLVDYKYDDIAEINLRYSNGEEFIKGKITITKDNKFIIKRIPVKKYLLIIKLKNGQNIQNKYKLSKGINYIEI